MTSTEKDTHEEPVPYGDDLRRRTDHGPPRTRLRYRGLDELLADPQGSSTDILTCHAVPERYDAEELAEAGTVTTVQGDELTVAGEPMSPTIEPVGDEQEQA